MSGEGREVAYTVTYLEMTARPEGGRPPAPLIPGLLLIKAERPPLRWFLHLYDSVGAPHHWTDRHDDDPEELAAWVANPHVELWTLMLTGWSAGFFALDFRKAPGACDLAYFGLAPEAIGRGLGRWLLSEAVHTGWDRPGVERMTVNTNTLDHPRALPMYQKIGFVPVRREETSRIVRG